MSRRRGSAPSTQSGRATKSGPEGTLEQVGVAWRWTGLAGRLTGSIGRAYNELGTRAGALTRGARLTLSYGSVSGVEVLLRRVACAVLVFVCLSLGSETASAQDSTPPTRPGVGFELEANYPNPFNPETTIPFTLGEELFAGGAPVVVTVRIFNLLSQLVAHPVALAHPAGAGVEVRGLEYTQPGRHEAFWDGTDQSGRQVASGIYLLMLTVNGQSGTRKMIVQK